MNYSRACGLAAEQQSSQLAAFTCARSRWQLSTLLLLVPVRPIGTAAVDPDDRVGGGDGQAMPCGVSARTYAMSALPAPLPCRGKGFERVEESRIDFDEAEPLGVAPRPLLRRTPARVRPGRQPSDMVTSQPG